MNEPRKVVIHPSLNRPKLLMGIEREPLIGSATMCVALGFNVWRIKPVAVLIVIALWLVVLFWLRRISKADPIMSKLWLRSIEYREWYPARSSIDSSPVVVMGRWKV